MPVEPPVKPAPIPIETPGEPQPGQPAAPPPEVSPTGPDIDIPSPQPDGDPGAMPGQPIG